MLDVSFSTFPELRTDRCLLRAVRVSDAPALFRLRSNPEVMRYVDREPFVSLSEAEALIGRIRASFDSNEGISWALCSGSEEMIGFVGIWRIDKENHRGEVGYTLQPKYWNRGLMTEALRAVVDYGFQHIGLHSLAADINPGNTASIRLAEKLGFVKEAHFRENYYFRGRFIDSAIYCLLRPE